MAARDLQEFFGYSSTPVREKDRVPARETRRDRAVAGRGASIFVEIRECAPGLERRLRPAVQLAAPTITTGARELTRPPFLRPLRARLR